MTATIEKKLVYVLNYVSTNDTQHYVHVLNLLTKLKELGWSVAVISEKGGIGTQHILGHDVHYMSRSGGVGRLLALGQKLISLRKEGYRLVFVRISKPAAIISGLLSFPCGWNTLFWLSGAIDDFNRKQPLWTRFKERLTLSATLKTIHIFVTGPETMIAYYENVFRLRRERMMLLYNDIDLGRYRPKLCTDDRRGELRVLLIHRLSPVRETGRYLTLVIDALNALTQRHGILIQVDVVGDGPERAELERAADLVGPKLAVKFHGAVPNTEVIHFYADADLFIMPSYREGFPRVIVEAMAMGLPIVSTDAGGTRDLFGTRQQEFVVPRDDAEAFASRIVELLSDAEKRRELSKENLKRVHRYSTEKVARMYDDKLSRVIAGELVA